MAKVKLLKHQMDFIKSKKPITMMVTGRGAGKSFTLGAKVIQLLLQKKSILVGAPTYQQLTDSVFQAILDSLDLHRIPYKHNISKKFITCMGQRIYGRSGEKYDSVRGITNVTALIVDEAALCSLAAIQVWAACLRGQTNANGEPLDPEMYFTSTPRGTQNWMYDYSLREDCMCIHAKARDNTKLSKAYHNQMDSMYAGVFAEQELGGGFVDFEGGFYNTDNITILKNTEQINVKRFCIAFDLAYTEKKKSDWSAAAFCCETVEGNFVILDVQRWKKEIGATQNIVREFIAKYAGYSSSNSIPAFVEANGAQVAIYQAFKNAGINLQKAKFSHISKSNRMFNHASEMENGKVFIAENVLLKDEIINEYKSFTLNDTHDHDDMIDAINYCALYFNNGTIKRLNKNI